MGLASSQARLLNLTTRMHQIEYKAAKIEAEKLQMANESRQVYLEYSEALEKTKVQIKTLSKDGSATFIDISNIEQMNKAGFTLVIHDVPVDADGNPVNTSAQAAAAPAAPADPTDPTDPTDPSAPATPATPAAPTVDHYQDVVITGNAEADISASEALAAAINAKFATSASETITVGTGADFERLLTNLINMGAATILQEKVNPDGTRSFPEVGDNDFSDFQSSIATNTSFQEITDESGLRKAEAKYEADMRRIDMKDRKYDYDLAALDNERNAIKQEMETLKTVAKDNVDRTFKLFS